MKTSNDLVRVILFAEVLDGLDVCLWVEVPT